MRILAFILAPILARSLIMPVGKRFTKSPDLMRQRHAQKVHVANFILKHARDYPCFSAKELTVLWNSSMPAVYPRVKGAYMHFRCDALVGAGHLSKVVHGVFTRMRGDQITARDVGMAKYPEVMAEFERAGESGINGPKVVWLCRAKARSVVMREIQALLKMGAIRKVVDKTRPAGQRHRYRINLMAPVLKRGPLEIARKDTRQKYMKALLEEDEANQIVDPFTGQPIKNQ